MIHKLRLDPLEADSVHLREYLGVMEALGRERAVREADREEAATTLEAARARITQLEALVMEWRAAARSVDDLRSAIDRAPNKLNAVTIELRAKLDVELERLDAAEIALAKSVPEAAEGAEVSDE